MLARSLSRGFPAIKRDLNTSATRHATSTATNANSNKHRDEGLGVLRCGAKRGPELYGRPSNHPVTVFN
jgi:hypothetical protein